MSIAELGCFCGFKVWRKELRRKMLKKGNLTVREPVSNQFHIQVISSVSSQGISGGEGRMKGEMRSRLALLSILLVVGLLMAAGAGPALGASNLLKFAGREVRVEAIGEQLKIYEDGKLVKEITIPEGEYSFTIEVAGHKLTHKIVIHKMTQEEIERAQAEYEKEMSKWLE
ncbi:MAG: hypothetical protein ACXQTV_01000, partial [Candidatus Hecatellaceae archaeon]